MPTLRPVRAGHVAGLTGLRAVAAFAVCVTHAAFWGGEFTGGLRGAFYGRLETAVPVFFALSGYLLVRPWLSPGSDGAPPSGPDLRRYFTSRAWRILPAYWTVVTVVYVIFLWRPDPTTTSGHGVGGYLRHLLFVQIYGVGHTHTGLTQMWSMSVEVAFYLVLPVLGAWLLSSSIKGVVPAYLVAVTVVWICLVVVTQVFGKTAGSWPPTYAAAFAAGIFVALYGHRIRRRWPLLLLAAGLYALLMSPLAGPIDLSLPTAAEGVTKFLAEAAIGGLLVAWAASGPARILGSRVMVRLGTISYEYFLIHMMAMEFVALDLFGWKFFQADTWVLVAVTTAVTIPLSWALHAAVERLRAVVTARRARPAA